MLRTGQEHLKSLRDGRVIYIGNEKVDDVTRHPAFRNAAATVAALYDMKADPANRDDMTYEEEGQPPLFLFPAAALARGFAAPYAMATAVSPISPTACSAARRITSPRS